MKNIYIERLRLAAKLSHRNDRSHHCERGIEVYHVYDHLDPQRLTWWDDVAFVLNDYRVALSWVHPRHAYQDRIKEEAHLRVEHLPYTDPFGEATPIHKKVGRSRKKISSYRTTSSIGDDPWVQAYRKELAQLTQDADYQIVPFMKSRWCKYSRLVELCIPVEIRNEDDLRNLAVLAKRLLKRETTLEQEFPGYIYTLKDWQRDNSDINSVQELMGALLKPDDSVSIEQMNLAITSRGALAGRGVQEEK